MKKAIFVMICLLPLLATHIYPQEKGFLTLKGPYLGQKPPGMTPEKFGPSILNHRKILQPCCFRGSRASSGKGS
jgi:hypothetical protein